MKRILLVMILFGLMVLPVDWAIAQEGDNPEGTRGDPYFDPPLCLPGNPADGTCSLLGPSQKVAALKEAGFPYPPRDLPAAAPPPELGLMPVLVAKINLPENEPAPIYGSFEDAVVGVNPSGQINPGNLRFISYISRQDYNGKAYVQLNTGGWMRASPAAYTNFQGLLFFDNPRNNFGWIVDQTPSYVSPDFNAATTGRNYVREDIIQVYSTVESGGVFWYQIARDEWVNSLKARSIALKTTPPEGVDTGRWIEIDLFQQMLMSMKMADCCLPPLSPPGWSRSIPNPGCSRSMKRSLWRQCKALLRRIVLISIICRMCPGQCILTRLAPCMRLIGAPFLAIPNLMVV